MEKQCDFTVTFIIGPYFRFSKWNSNLLHNRITTPGYDITKLQIREIFWRHSSYIFFQNINYIIKFLICTISLNFLTAKLLRFLDIMSSLLFMNIIIFIFIVSMYVWCNIYYNFMLRIVILTKRENNSWFIKNILSARDQ